MDLLNPVLVAETSANLGPMIDSGAHTSVCPPSFAPEVPVIPGKGKVELISVTGDPLRAMGERSVCFRKAWTNEEQLDHSVRLWLQMFVVPLLPSQT